jgi:signal transduction histidine kinase
MSEAPDQQGTRSWAWLGRVPAWVWDAIPVVVLAAGIGLNASIVRPASLLTVAVGLVGVAVLLARRRAPRAVFVTTGLAAFVAIAEHNAVAAPVVVAVLVALYTVDTRCSRRWSLAASAVAFGGSVLAEGVALGPGSNLLAVMIAPAALITALWVIGDNLRVRRAYVAGLEERAAWVDEQRAADARRAASNERARIARELHDVVAHHVAVMAVQAGAARMLNETVDPQTRDLLGSIENSAHQAMSELRRLLGVLRREDLGPSSPAPQPGLRQLDRLIDQVRQAGLPVALTVRGEPHALPDWVDLSAYRIVQEALTNVLKHAGPTQTSVCLTYAASEVTLEVTNQPPAEAPLADDERPGHGLIGMRERVAMAGGELRAGPTQDGGFEVFARLPVEGRRPVPRQAQLTAGRP